MKNKTAYYDKSTMKNKSQSLLIYHQHQSIKSVLVKTAQENLQITVMQSVIIDGGNFEQIFYSGE
jgi:exo-beta-1,3-glucanase (GH17 family)